MCQSRIMLIIEFSNNAKLRVIDKKFLDLCLKLREQVVAVFWVEANASSKQLSALPSHLINGEIVFKVFIWIYKIIFLTILYYFPVFFLPTIQIRFLKVLTCWEWSSILNFTASTEHWITEQTCSLAHYYAVQAGSSFLVHTVHPNVLSKLCKLFMLAYFKSMI